MKKKQAWKVMGAVLAGTLVFSDAVPLRASASAGTEKSAVQNETVSGTENGTETKTKRAAVYVNLKTGDDTADGTTAETAVKTVEKAQELLAAAAAELQADGKTTEKNTAADTSKTAAEEAAEKYLVFVGMDEKELETYRKKQQKTDFWGRVTDTVFAADEIVVTEAGYEGAVSAGPGSGSRKSKRNGFGNTNACAGRVSGTGCGRRYRNTDSGSDGNAGCRADRRTNGDPGRRANGRTDGNAGRRADRNAGGGTNGNTDTGCGQRRKYRGYTNGSADTGCGTDRNAGSNSDDSTGREYR